MKRSAISAMLFFAFLLNVVYCIVIGVTIVRQEEMKLAAGCTAEVAQTFTIPFMYIIFAVITLLMEFVLILNFSNSMRFESPTVWIEWVSAVLYGGAFRIFYHYIPSLDSKFALARDIVMGSAAYESRMAMDALIQGYDWIFALSSAFFLVGIGMTICFKKFVRYFLD